MDQTTKDKLAINLGSAWKMWSNRVMAAAGLLFAWYLSLPAVCPPDQLDCASQALLKSHLPFPAWMLPLIVSFIGIATRIFPQAALSPTVAEAKSAATPVDHADVPAPLKSLTELDLDLTKRDRP